MDVLRDHRGRATPLITFIAARIAALVMTALLRSRHALAPRAALAFALVATALCARASSAYAQQSSSEPAQRSLFGPRPGDRASTALPVRLAEPERPEPDGIRRRLGFTFAAGGGAALGALSAPIWHAASLRIGVQFYSPFALYLQSQFLLGAVAQPNGGGVFLALNNHLLAELSLQNYLQIAFGPSVDLADQRECGAGCSFTRGLWFGLHQRVAVPLISRPSFGRTTGARGPSRAINLAVDFHENFTATGLLVTGTIALGLDWY